MKPSLVFLALAWCGTLIVTAEPPRLIINGGTNDVAAGDSRLSAMTPDARLVVFTSDARNLTVHGDRQRYTDVFVRNAQTQETTLVSVNTNGAGGGDDDSSCASISPDGRYVVFASAAGNLVPGDTNGVSDIFRRDLQTSRTELVSVAISGGVPAASTSRRFLGAVKPVITPDGRYVAFESSSTDLVAGDTNQTEKIFLRDMQNGTTVLASGKSQRCSSPSLSSNAVRVAFVANDSAPNYSDVFTRDLETGVTYIASASTFPGTARRCFDPVLGPDGRFVVFKAMLPSTPPVEHLVQNDVGSVSGSALATNFYHSSKPSLSRDGRWLAFEEKGNLYLRDIENRTNILVSAKLGGGGPASARSHTPVVNGDGRYVAFLSSSPELINGLSAQDTNSYRLYIREVSALVTRLITRATNGVPAVIGSAAQLLISPDGARVAFDTDLSALANADHNDAFDVFVQEIGAMPLLVSAPNAQRRAVTGIRSMTLKPNSVSADGSRVAFAMPDVDVIPSDTNRNMDVFVRDLRSGALMPQSSDSNGVFLTTRRAVNPFLSADGQHILFETWEPASEQYSGRGRLFWKQVASTAAMEIESVALSAGDWSAAINSNGTLVATWNAIYDLAAGTRRPGLGSMRRPMFSPNDQWIVGKRGTLESMYAEYVPTNKSVLVSKDTSGQALRAVGGAFSGSGRYYVFDTPNEVYRYDFEADSTELISTNANEPSIDYTGNLIAFASSPDPMVERRQIYIRDVASGRTDLITRDAYGIGPADGNSRMPLISSDGRYLVFVSGASDLVLGDNNGAEDIFVNDRAQRTMLMLTRNRQGEGSANALSSMPVLAADGRTVVFQSFASDLVDGDYNDERDIFVVKLGVGDSDNDGMDDDWEVAHFGDLNRDGAGDQDGDGQIDLQEFLAGTDPSNSGSVLRVLTITPMGGGSTTVVWSAVVGRNYVVQYKESLAASWANASGVLAADSTSMSFTQSSSSPQRFYRVIAVQ